MQRSLLGLLLFAIVLAWSTAASAAPVAHLVADINTTKGGASSGPSGFVRVGNVVYFSATDGDHGRELWKTDGTKEGTVLVADIAKGTQSSNPYAMTALGETVFFFADDGVNGLGLWRSNGSAVGTRLVRAMPSKSKSGLPLGVVPANDVIRAADDVVFLVYYGHDEGTSQLWRSDGTTEGTVLVFEDEGSIGDTIVRGSGLAFRDGSDHLWHTFGTPESTWRVSSSSGSAWAVMGETLFFEGTPEQGQNGLWKTDGTKAGTLLVAPVTGLRSFARFGDALFFGAADGLWKTDGSPGGTVPVTQSVPAVDRLAATGDRLFFASCADPTSSTCVAYVSDGTELGTHPLPIGAALGPFHVVGSGVFFEATVGQDSDGLWWTDGKTDEREVVELGPCCGHVAGAIPWKGGLAFSTTPSRLADGAHDPLDLWWSDGTALGTTRLASGLPAADLTTLDAIFLFASADDTRGAELWKSDGTAAGTGLVRDIEPGGQSSNPTLLTNADGVLHFMADDGVHGAELWKSDGTASGTKLVADVTAGAASTDAVWLAPIGRDVLLLRRLPSRRMDLWTTDAAGAHLRETFAPADESSFLGVIEGTAYFTLNEDLWKSDGSSASLVRHVGTNEVSDYFNTTAIVGAHLFFVTSTGVWRTDGTESGTVHLSDLRPTHLGVAGNKVVFALTNELVFVDADSSTPTSVGTFGWSIFAPRATLGGSAFAFVLESDGAFSVWKTDATRAGTTRIATLAGFPGDHIVVSEGTLFFTSRSTTTVTHDDLWTSDGTAHGTRLLRRLDITRWGEGSSDGLAPLPGGGVIFAGPDRTTGASGGEPWISDGTEAGTRPLQQIAPFARSSSPAAFTVSGDRVFFTAADGLHGRELWILPPTVEQPKGCACSAPGREDGPGVPLAVIATAALAALGRARRSTAARRSR